MWAVLSASVTTLNRASAEESQVPIPVTRDSAPVADSIVTVVGELDAARNQILPALGASSYIIDKQQIEAQSRGANAPFNQVLLRMPGVVQDSYGQVHVRGEHANLQFRINDVIIPEGVTTFGQEFDTRIIRSVALITGVLPAQYGLRTAGVVDISTKSGAIDPGGSLTLSAGSNKTLSGNATYGGTAGNTDAFVNVGVVHTELGIENPTDETTSIHNTSNQGRGFGYVSYVLDQSSRVSVMGGMSDARFEIPNSPNQTPGFTVNGVSTGDSTTLDENQKEKNAYGVMAYQKSIGVADIQVAGFVRTSQVKFIPDDELALIFNGVAGSLDRKALVYGGQLDGKIPLDESHTLRGGAAYSQTRADIRTTTLVLPVDAAGNQTSDTPISIADDQAATGSFTSVYVQDEWRLNQIFTAHFGVRYDLAKAYVDESQISPRFSLVAKPTTSTTIHAGYARILTPPPLENVDNSSVAKFDSTTNASEVSRNDPVRAERSNYCDVGITQRIFSAFQLGWDGYYKDSAHQVDDGQFGSALVFTPFNYARGRVYGSEVTATYEDGDWTAFVNTAVSRAESTQIESAQFLFSQAELDYAEENYVHVDHDQLVAASAGVSYLFPSRTRLLCDGIVGSGLRAGFANTERVAGYATANVGVSQDLGPLSLRLDVLNIFDSSYQIRDGSGIGVGAPQYAARRGFLMSGTLEF